MTLPIPYKVFCPDASVADPVRRLMYAIMLLTGLLLVACDDLESVLPDVTVVETDQKGALYILCDGNYSLNNSTLALYDFNRNQLDNDFFQTMTGRKLGDTGNEIQQYGSKLYIVVNASSQIEVLDAFTGESLSQIPLFDGTVARQPRYLAFWQNKAYVCSFDGTVARIDTASLEVDAFAQAGRNPDGIAAGNGKLYVSNSGGLDFASSLGYDNTVSVIDIATFTEVKRITVGLNPYRIRTDDFGYVWVACRGDYGQEAGSWWCIDSNADKVITSYSLEVMNFDLLGDLAYLYHFDNELQESWIKVFNLKTRQMERESFITDGTTITTPYGINVNPVNGDVFITDAGNYVTSGHVYCFRSDGSLRYKLSHVGVSPNSVVLVPQFSGAAEDTTQTNEIVDSYIYRVHDYCPAPGQFVGQYPAYNTGDDAETMRSNAELLLKGGTTGLVSLGRFGGSLTFSFAQAVLNQTASADFKIYGNAFSNGAEPGIVEVSLDRNQNGLPDDDWFELAGSDYSNPLTLHNYQIVYYRPVSLTDSVFFRDNQGNSGYVKAGYPAWQTDSIVCRGTCLAPTASQDATTGYWSLANLDWGYADNQTNTSGLNTFDLDWAVDANGQSVILDSIHFIRVYTAVNQDAGWLGELSTEVTGAENLTVPATALSYKNQTGE